MVARNWHWKARNSVLFIPSIPPVPSRKVLSVNGYGKITSSSD